MFPVEGVNFLRGLARNNDREWFQQRKDVYETQCKLPMIALVESINAALLDFAPEHVTDPKTAIYRIYRDTRFSGDKTPYKTHVAAIFPRKGLGKHTGASYYFQISAKTAGIATGLYGAGPQELYAVRSMLAERHDEFRQLAQSAAKNFGPLTGDAVTRMPKGFDAKSPAEDLIRMKQWLFWHEFDAKLATEPGFVKDVVKHFRIATPVLEMLNACLIQGKAPSMLD
jgi:uncharacterized protein (TIGR02453 family)